MAFVLLCPDITLSPPSYNCVFMYFIVYLCKFVKAYLYICVIVWCNIYVTTESCIVVSRHDLSLLLLSLYLPLSSLHKLLSQSLILPLARHCCWITSSTQTLKAQPTMQDLIWHNLAIFQPKFHIFINELRLLVEVSEDLLQISWFSYLWMEIYVYLV